MGVDATGRMEGGGGEDAMGRKIEVGGYRGGGEVWMQSKERSRRG